MSVMDAPMGKISPALVGAQRKSYRSLEVQPVKGSEYVKHRIYEKMMVQIPNMETPAKEIPKNCRECMYYQPRWRYRTCLYVRCPYGKKVNPFRKQESKKETIQFPEVVDMSGI